MSIHRTASSVGSPTTAAPAEAVLKASATAAPVVLLWRLVRRGAVDHVAGLDVQGSPLSRAAVVATTPASIVPIRPVQRAAP